MEFESQRKRSIDIDREEVVSEMQVKKACYVELKVPVLPSPTTTFARLNVNQPSPSSDFSPLNALKCLNQSPNGYQRSIVSPTNNFQFASCTNVSRDSSSPNVNSRNFLSVTPTLHTPAGSNSSRTESHYKQTHQDTTLRGVSQSKEYQRRPNTIPISTLQVPYPSERVKVISNDDCSPGGCHHSPRSTVSVAAIAGSCGCNGSSPEVTKEKSSPSALLWQVELVCKSRSLEDILTRTETTDTRCLKNTSAAKDIYQPGNMDLGPRWQAESQQSNDSVPSIGSHTGSMHGSLEIMSVF